MSESCESMIQSPFIKREDYFIPEWISRLNESNEDIYRHLLADLVSYLEYHLINNNKNNKNIKGIVHPKIF